MCFGAALSAICTAFSCASCMCTTCQCCCSLKSAKANPVCIKILYCLTFLLSCTVALVLKVYGQDLLEKIPVIQICTNQECYGNNAVYRIGFCLSIFFFVLAILTLGKAKLNDWRTIVQNGFFIVKLLLLIGLMIGSFFIPNNVFNVYANISIFGSSLFIIIQMLILVDFAYWVNEYLVSKSQDDMDNEKKWLGLILFLAIICFILSSIFIIASYVWFSGQDCHLNNFFITFTWILAITVTFMSLRAEHGAILPSSVVTLFCSYTLFTALSSVESCNKMSEPHAGQLFGNWIGFVITVGSVLYQATNVSSKQEVLATNTADYTEKLPVKSEEKKPLNEEEGAAEDDDEVPDEPAPYSYWYFHITFTVASMYVTMLMSNWMTENKDGKIDHGVASLWVKMASQWVTYLLYGWTLAAPYILKNRDFGFDV